MPSSPRWRSPVPSTSWPRGSWAERRRRSSWASSAPCGVSTAATRPASPCSPGFRPAGPGCSRGPVRTPAPSTSGAGWPASSRSSPTTIRRRSSRTRAPRPVSGASSVTSSRWGRAPSPCSTRCVSGPSRTPPSATSSTVSSPGSAAMATASACRRWAVSSTSTTPTVTTAWSTPCVWGSSSSPSSPWRPPRARVIWCSWSAPTPGGTGSTAPPSPRWSSTTRPASGVPRSRSATPSSRSA